jgi:methyl-accepting chemotaxis protein
VFNFASNARIQNALAQTAAINRSQAVIEFKLDGTIVTANENFLTAMGYRLEEIKGKHHGMFVDPAEREGRDYREFWTRLNRGEFQAAQYKRFGKGGKEIWIQASYNPILDASGEPVGVIKFATDITAQKIRSMEDAGKIAAMNRAQAVIEFNMDGTIVTANENFLGAMGYSLAEIQGKHHSMFVLPAERDGTAYREFWAKLNRGQFDAAEYKRVGKGAKEIWILATYNPILDDAGKPFKVVKFATDVTAQKLKAADSDGQIAAIGKSQAVIEFNMAAPSVPPTRISSTRWAIRSRKSRASIMGCSSNRASAMRRPTANSGATSTVASTRRRNTSASPRVAAKSGSRRPTIRSSTSTAGRSRW